jgi:hypothetical protein
MVFKKCSINNVIYGDPTELPEDQIPALNMVASARNKIT